MRSDAGFTLIEVLVALVVAGIVVMLAHQVFAATTEGSRTLLAMRDALDRPANARRVLKATFGSLEVGGESSTGFDGEPDHATFAAWERTAQGWFALRRVELNVKDTALVLSEGSSRAITLQDSVAELSLDYLLQPGVDAHWVRRWVSPASAPLAVRLRIARLSGTVDTLLYLIGSRG